MCRWDHNKRSTAVDGDDDSDNHSHTVMTPTTASGSVHVLRLLLLLQLLLRPSTATAPPAAHFHGSLLPPPYASACPFTATASRTAALLFCQFSCNTLIITVQ
jgi:hypothetical protein